MVDVGESLVAAPRAILGDAAARQHHHVVDERRDGVEVVRHHDEDAAARALLAQDLGEQRRTVAVEAGERLVGEEELRLVHDGARHRQALQHAARVGARRAAGGVGEPDTLEQRIGGAEASSESRPDDEALRGAIGVIAHESHCYGDLTGHENLVFFARLYGVADARATADKLLARVGLRDAANRAARTYSRGMLQRLAVARALVHKPRLLLADEPFTGLDRAGVALLAELLAEERARGCIMVVVTHDFDAVAPLIDRVVVLARGRIAHDAPAPAARSTAALADVYRTALES